MFYHVIFKTKLYLAIGGVGTLAIIFIATNFHREIIATYSY